MHKKRLTLREAGFDSKKAETKDFAQVLTRLAQLNQSKVYLFWGDLRRV
jgi:hypothetical protein